MWLVWCRRVQRLGLSDSLNYTLLVLHTVGGLQKLGDSKQVSYFKYFKYSQVTQSEDLQNITVRNNVVAAGLNLPISC